MWYLHKVNKNQGIVKLAKIQGIQFFVAAKKLILL